MEESYLRHVRSPRLRGEIRDPETFDLRPLKGARKGARDDKTTWSER